VHVVFPPAKHCTGVATAAFIQLNVTKSAPLQANVSYTVETHGYQGKTLNVEWSLMRRDSTGSFTPVPGFVRLPAAQVSPDACTSDEGGGDIPIPVFSKGDYQVVLELFPPNGIRITRRAANIALL
jgi:hypothetical protein